VVSEAPFLVSVAPLSCSLAGPGLGAALRRGTDLRAIDALRLREFVDVAVAVVPVSFEPPSREG
jgi:hypothetical protein